MMLLQVERLKRAKSIDQLVVATSDQRCDDTLAKTCQAADLLVHRGALDDVLDRFYTAVAADRPSHIVRLTADCPLADWEVIDKVIASCLTMEADYASNTLKRTWPDGLDVEVMRFSALEKAWREARTPGEREHVTPYIHRNPDSFRLVNVEKEGEDLSDLRWTVDEPEDFRFVEAVYQELYPSNAEFLTADILELLQRRPELVEIGSQERSSPGQQGSPKIG